MQGMKEIMELDEAALAAPIKEIEEKWKLLPAFLEVRGLMKEHILSYNYFVTTEIKKIMEANDKVVSDVDPKVFFRYLDIYVGSPELVDDNITKADPPFNTPHTCRLRDRTYAAPIYVDIEQVKNGQRYTRKKLQIGLFVVST